MEQVVLDGIEEAAGGKSAALGLVPRLEGEPAGPACGLQPRDGTADAAVDGQVGDVVPLADRQQDVLADGQVDVAVRDDAAGLPHVLAALRADFKAQLVQKAAQGAVVGVEGVQDGLQVEQHGGQGGQLGRPARTVRDLTGGADQPGPAGGVQMAQLPAERDAVHVRRLIVQQDHAVGLAFLEGVQQGLPRLVDVTADRPPVRAAQVALTYTEEALVIAYHGEPQGGGVSLQGGPRPFCPGPASPVGTGDSALRSRPARSRAGRSSHRDSLYLVKTILSMQYFSQTN